MSDARWLLLMCASRGAFSLIFTAYAAVIPLVQAEWGMTSGETGLVQSAWHVGYLISLFGVGLLVDRIGARDTYLATSLAACVPRCGGPGAGRRRLRGHADGKKT